MTEPTTPTPFEFRWDIGQRTDYIAALFGRDVIASQFVHQVRRRWLTDDATANFDGRVLASDISRDEEDFLVRSDGGVLARVRLSRGAVNAEVAGPDPDSVRAYLDQLVERYPVSVVDSTHIMADFWYLTPNGPQTTTRVLTAPSWDDISENYGREQQAELNRLLAPDWRPGSGGQLLLWHGLPGCGKTYAIRALVRGWKPWCRTSYITDPDDFLGRASYMMQALLRERESPVPASSSSDPQPAEAEWNLLILEDCGELLSKDAKQRVGQNLARLLNITDGFIGQGLRVLVLITTNEETGLLHDAVVRPGRCASQLEFGPLGPREAAAWLARRGIEAPPGARTIAELYARVRGDGVVPVPHRQPGFLLTYHRE